MREELTQERLKELLHYDPETGAWTWLVDRGGARKGKRAGCLAPNGYWYVRVNGYLHLSHRLAFLYMLGKLPDDEVDHINCLPSDNRWTNLRPCTRTQNEYNSGPRRNNKTGMKGVYFCKRRQRFISRIRDKGKHRWLGQFLTATEAAAAYNVAAIQLHGEFAVLNPI